LDANTALQGLAQAHAYRLVARLGVASRYPNPSQARRGEASDGSHRIVYYETGLSEASLRLRLGPPDADEGIQIGLMPLQGNSDATLYGNYLARYQPYPMLEARALEAWDSLGALAPQVAGVRLALGRNGGPVRAEGWLVRDGEDFSWLAFLSGRAPRKIGWGLGVSGHRVFSLRDNLSTPANSRTYRDSSGGVFIEDGDSSSTDTIYFLTYSGLLLSARASVDFASLFGSDTPEGRYGGLFAEAALLGWKEFPIYYPDRWSRFTWTAGTRIPTFGWLDACVAQVEWRRATEDIFRGYRNATWIGSVSPVPVGSDTTYGNGGPNPGFDYLGPAPRPSPWSFGLLLGKDFGPHAGVQAWFLTYEANEAWSGPSRQVEALARIVFRFR
jgi:hypothetical protein